MAIWHLGEGRHKEKLRAAAPGNGDLGLRCPELSLFLLSLPFSRRTHEKSVQGQGQAQPPGSGVDSIPPRTGNRDRGGVEAMPPPPKQEGRNATETAQ